MRGGITLVINFGGLQGKYVALELSSGSKILGQISEIKDGEIELIEALFISYNAGLADVLFDNYLYNCRERQKTPDDGKWRTYFRTYRVAPEHVTSYLEIMPEEIATKGKPPSGTEK